jgi:hypothetical protein
MGATKVVYSNKIGPQRPSGFDLTPGALVCGQGIYEYSSTQKARIGERLAVGNRVFRYAYNGGVALHGGYVVSSPLLGGAASTVQSDISLAVAAYAGDTRLFLAAATTAQPAGTFNDGWVGVQDETNADAHIFQIKNQPLLANSGTTSYIDLYDGIPADLAVTTTELDLCANPYKGVIVTPNGPTPACMTLGVAPLAVPINYYFWLQTWGPAFAWCAAENQPVAGMPVAVSDGNDGSVEIMDGVNTGAIIGQGMLVYSAVSEPVMIFLQLAP